MDKYEIIEELKKVIGEYLAGCGLVLVELVYRQEGRGLVLRILADRPTGGISLGECVVLNSGIGALLDEKNILETGYILEVSSPGVDRPLTSKSDFSRCPDKRVRVFLREQQEAKWELEGIIRKVTDEFLYLEIGPGGVVEIPFARINKAKQVI